MAQPKPTLGQQLKDANRKLQEATLNRIISRISTKLETLLATLNKPLWVLTISFAEDLKIEPHTVDAQVSDQLVQWATGQELRLSYIYDHAACEDCNENAPSCQMKAIVLSW